MNLFGVGGFELIVVLVIGFLALGPVSYTHLTLPTSDLV